MQATARMASVVSAMSTPRRRLIRDVRPTNQVFIMFGWFKKKTPEAPPPLPNDRLAAINRQFEEFAEGEIDPLEGALTMFHLDRDRYVPNVLDALQSATVELLISENIPTSPPLMLSSASGYPMLAVFTQRKRVAKCQEHHPEYQYYIRLPFQVALKSLREEAGIVINPFVDVISWEMPPDLVKIVRGTLIPDSRSLGRPPPLPRQ